MGLGSDMNLGAAEILVILVVALLVFGPQKLPEIGRQVGGAMRELRKMQDSVKHELKTALDDEPRPATTPRAASGTRTPAVATPASNGEDPSADHTAGDHTANDQTGGDRSVGEEGDHSDPVARDGFDGPTGSFS
jgi:sec-independent protein translocase protein TatA